MRPDVDLDIVRGTEHNLILIFSYICAKFSDTINILSGGCMVYENGPKSNTDLSPMSDQPSEAS